jgi:hypothetical protein
VTLFEANHLAEPDFAAPPTRPPVNVIVLLGNSIPARHRRVAGNVAENVAARPEAVVAANPVLEPKTGVSESRFSANSSSVRHRRVAGNLAGNVTATPESAMAANPVFEPKTAVSKSRVSAPPQLNRRPVSMDTRGDPRLPGLRRAEIVNTRTVPSRPPAEYGARGPGRRRETSLRRSDSRARPFPRRECGRARQPARARSFPV